MPGAPLSLVNPPTQPPTDDKLPKYVSRNAILVFCAGVGQYKDWKEEHKFDIPKKDAAKDFPGLDMNRIKTAVAPLKDRRPLCLPEIERYAKVLANCWMFHYRNTADIYTIQQPNEELYDRLATVKINGNLVLPLLLSRENEEHWVALLCLAVWARPTDKSLSDDQAAQLLGISPSSVSSARVLLEKKGIRLAVPGGASFELQVTLEATALMKGTNRKFCLPQDLWVLPETPGLDAVFEEMNKTPVESVKKVSPVKVVPAAPEALSLSHLLSPDDRLLVQSLAGKQTPDEYLADLVGGFLAVKLASIRQKQERVAALAAEHQKILADAAERALAVQLQIDELQDTDD